MRSKKILSIITSAAMTAGIIGGGYMNTLPAVTAAQETTIIKWYNDIFTLVQDEVTSSGIHTQWYAVEDTVPFRTDGLSVTYNSKDITDDCDIFFKSQNLPSKYYTGKEFDYDIPIGIKYENRDIESALIAKIGKKNDANMDHRIDVRDAAIIARDVTKHKSKSGGVMNDFAKFLVTGNRVDGAYGLQTKNAADIAKKLADEAILRATGKKLERTDGTSGCALALSTAKGAPGETVTIQVLVSANKSFEGMDALIEWDGDTFEASKAFSTNKSVLCESAAGDGVISIVNYGNADTVSDGFMNSINVTIPPTAKPGDELELYFSDVKTFSVLDSEGNSNDLSGNINIKGTKVTVIEPINTTPAVTTAAAETTTSTVAVTTSASSQATTSAASQTVSTTVTSNTTAVNTTNTTAASSTAPAATTTAQTQGAVIPGDINLDGKVDIRDPAMLARLIVLKKVDTLNKQIADFNGDGKIDIRDAAAIAKFISARSLAE